MQENDRMPAQVIRTDSGRCYVYDGLTSQIITMKKSWPPEQDRQVCTALEKRGMIRPAHFSKVVWQSSFDEYLENMRHGVPRLMLQLTRRCNLNCRYCVYSGNYAHMQPHADEDMSEDTIRRSIDVFSEVCRGVPDVSVHMYGGEALLRLDLMKLTVAYARQKLEGHRVTYHITSNGLLLNDGVGSWLQDNPEVFLTVTVNGPYHDQYRVTHNHRGSLDLIMKNLEYIRSSYPDVWENQLRFLSNIVHPGHLGPLRRFYDGAVGKPPVSITHIRAQHGNDVIREILAEPGETACFDQLREEYCRRHDPFLDAYFGKGARAVHTRPVYAADADAYVGSCFPLADRIFVHANGDLGICESACDKVVVGNIHEGLDIPALRQIYEEAAALLNRKCTSCWAQRLCTICLKDLFDENGRVLPRIPEEFCRASRAYSMEQLKMYCRIAEQDPGRLELFEAEQPLSGL